MNAISPPDKIEENPPVPFQFGRCLAASSSTSGTIKAGATAEKARPRASELASPIQPTNHGMPPPAPFYGDKSPARNNASAILGLNLTRY